MHKKTEVQFQSFITAYEKLHGPCPRAVLTILRDFFMAGFTTAFFRYHTTVNGEGPQGETDDQLLARINAEIAGMHDEVRDYAVSKVVDNARNRAATFSKN